MIAELELQGDQIAHYNVATVRRASGTGHEVTLCDVCALDSHTRAVRVEAEPSAGLGSFPEGSYRLVDEDGEVIARHLKPDTDMFAQLAVGSTHVFFTDARGKKFMVDLKGLPGTSSTLVYASDGRTMERQTAARPSPAVTERTRIALAEGTRVACDRGRLAVEDLVPGVRIWTVDSGLQPLVGLNCQTLRFGSANKHLRPVRIAANALGRGCPSSDLIVAPEQRLLVTGWRAELFFGREEILTSAHAMLSMPGVQRETSITMVRYYELILAGNHMVEVGGVMADGSFMGSRSRGDLGSHQLNAVRDLQQSLPRGEESGYILGCEEESR